MTYMAKTMTFRILAKNCTHLLFSSVLSFFQFLNIYILTCQFHVQNPYQQCELFAHGSVLFEFNETYQPDPGPPLAKI